MKGEAIEHTRKHTNTQTRTHEQDRKTSSSSCSRSWGEFSKWLHAIQLNFRSHFGTFFPCWTDNKEEEEMPKPLCLRSTSFCSILDMLATVNASHVHFLQLPFCHSSTLPPFTQTNQAQFFFDFHSFCRRIIQRKWKIYWIYFNKKYVCKHSLPFHVYIQRARAHFFTHSCMHITHTRTTRTPKMRKDAEPANRQPSKH